MVCLALPTFAQQSKVVTKGPMVIKEFKHDTGQEPTHRIRESASPGFRLPILRFPRPGRTDEPTRRGNAMSSPNGSLLALLSQAVTYVNGTKPRYSTLLRPDINAQTMLSFGD